MDERFCKALRLYGIVGKKFNKEIAKLFAPRSLKEPAEWAFESCILRDNITELPGAFRAFPYAKEPLNSMVDPNVSKITLCWGSQSGKTSHMYVGVGYLLSEFPKDTLWIMPSAENARNFSKGRWLPFLEDCKPLRAQCPISPNTGRVDSEKITNMRQEFFNCTLTFAGAGSENNVKSAPIAYLILDEIDEIDPDIRLAALERIKGRREYKIIQTSTPKEAVGGIYEEFLNGDQRRYHVPCPHCNELIDFQWRQTEKKRFGVQFDESAKLKNGEYDFLKVQRSAYYICQKCDGKILDAHKPKMLREGTWISENPNAPSSHRSYHLNSLYAPAMRFSDFIIAWLQGNSSVHGVKKFVQGNLAEPWREDWINTEEAEANSLELEYERGEIKGEYRIIAADTQQDSYRYVVRGFDQDGKSYLIDFGTVPSFNDLDEKFSTFMCHKGIVDCGGNRTQEVYDEVFKRRSAWFGSRGWAKMTEPYRLQHKDPYTGDTKGRASKGKFLYLHIDKGIWEPEIAKLRVQKLEGFYTFKETPKEYYDQLFAPYWTQLTDKYGKTKLIKKLKGKRGDHYFDCECMARALSKFIGIARADRQVAPPRKKKNAATRQRTATSFW